MPPTALSPSKTYTSIGNLDDLSQAASLPNPPTIKAERGIYSELLSQTGADDFGGESMVIEDARMESLPPVSVSCWVLYIFLFCPFMMHRVEHGYFLCGVVLLWLPSFKVCSSPCSLES